MNAAQPAQFDTYSTDRGSLIERMAILAGKTSWREPAQGSSTVTADRVPWEHVLASATVWLREHRLCQDDVTGEILHALAIMDMPRPIENRCVAALAKALADMSAMCARMSVQQPGLLDACTRVVLRKCVTGADLPYPPRATRSMVGFFDAFGATLVWRQATEGLRRAAKVLA